MNFKVSILVLALIALSSCSSAQPFNIIIVTRDAASEQGYTEFLTDIYRGNVQVNIDALRYDENLSANKKSELQAADLIIVSRDNSGKDYNADSAFWNALDVPILNHCINLTRSNAHNYWDWLDGNKTSTDPSTQFEVSDANDIIFSGVDTSSGTVTLFVTGSDVDHSNQASPGYGTLIATVTGDVAIARWQGDEPWYYAGSDFAPAGPRLFFALPILVDFFADATDDAVAMLKNAILSLLPIYHPLGDIDGDRDVDLDDVGLFSGRWQEIDCQLTNGCGGADIDGLGTVDEVDLGIIMANWFEGIDLLPPEPNVMTWLAPPVTQSITDIYMSATPACDADNGLEYYFECVSQNAPDSGWQYGNIFEPNSLTPGTSYVYRTVARDTSSRLNETQYSTEITETTFGIYQEVADASAAVAIDPNLFIVADDENDRLSVYRWGDMYSQPIVSPGIGAYININPDHPEPDIEGATWFNGRVFWICSHGRNKNGNYWYSRYNFFATTITPAGQSTTVTVDGNYTSLIDDLIAYDGIYTLGLVDAIGVVGGTIDESQIPSLAPKQQGLNIEGLCTSADANSIFIAFRNPQPLSASINRALIIELLNPEEVVLTGASAIFAPPILLDLGGLGIRSMEYDPQLGRYLIVAGSHLDSTDDPLQILYTYNMSTQVLIQIRDYPIITPEAMFQFPGSDVINLLSDDGTRLIDTPSGPVENKLLPREQRTFRTHQIVP